MAWRMSTGMNHALLKGQRTSTVNVQGDGISMGDGDGAGSTDTINNASGLDVITIGDFVRIISSDANDGIVAQALTVTGAKIEVAAGTLTAVSAGTNITIEKMSGGGSLAELMRNGVIEIYSGTRPSSANDVATGSLLCVITRDGGTFVADASANGLNLGDMDGDDLKRAIDESTTITELWRGIGIYAASAGWARWYDNSFDKSGLSTAVRMDGLVATSGGDLNMTNGTTIAVDIYSEVSDVSHSMGTA